MPTKGITISVTAETNAGGRRHMEDYLAVKLCPNEELCKSPDLREQAFVGVFDGHGGKEAAKFARERLWDIIQTQPKYLSSDVEAIQESIQEAFLALHQEMEPLRRTWKRNKMGDLSTAGTTVSTVIFRQDNIFVANVGDSTAVLAVSNPRAHLPGQHALKACVLTKDHKPEDPDETRLIQSLGGRVMVSRKGVPRVVWERRRNGGMLEEEEDEEEDGEVDLIPFLSVSRSLGDFWSFNPRTKQFVVSPKPDVHVHPLNPEEQKFIVIATDGLWNVMSPKEVIEFIWDYEHDDQRCHQPKDVVRAVINEALKRWKSKNLLADNIAVLIAFLSNEEAIESQPLVSGLGDSSCSPGDVAGPSGSPTSALSTPTLPTPGAETGVSSKVRENPTSSSPSSPSKVINVVSNSKSGSTSYYKETFPDGVTIEYHTKVKLRHRRKEKHPRKEPKAKLQGSDPTGETSKMGKREKSDDTSIVPPAKRTRVELPDSGCDSDGDKMDTEISRIEEKHSPMATEENGSDSSSGVFSDENENGVSEGMLEPATMSGTALPGQVEEAIHNSGSD